MDGLSIAASVAGIAQVGFSIAKGLYTVADQMTMAGLEVRLYAKEIDAFAKLLLTVQRTVSGLTCSASEMAEIKTQIKFILETCDDILRPLQAVQEALVPLLSRFRDSPSKMLQVALRIRWTFVSKGKVLFYRELLQRQHQMLDTHLARAILVSTKTASKSDARIVDMLSNSLENSASALNHNIAFPSAAEEQSRAQLLLGFSTDTTRASDLLVQPKPSRGVHVRETSMALVSFTSSTTFSPGDGPALDTLTEDERESVLKATSLDIDTRTFADMQQMLDDTEAAEKKAVAMVSETLSSESGSPVTESRWSQWRPGSSSSVARYQCGPNVIGGWSKLTKRVFRKSQLRYEVLYEVPVFLVTSPTGPYGTAAGKKVLILDGSVKSFAESFIPSNARDHFLLNELRAEGAKRAPPRAQSDEATWLALLAAVLNMESKSRYWERHSFHGLFDSEVKNENAATDLHDHSLVVCMYRQQSSWDALPPHLHRPYAVTTMADLVYMMAMLGVYWEVFDRARHRYLAQGNGSMLSGFEEKGSGLYFSYQSITEQNWHTNRVVPSFLVKELCFGKCPTKFWGVSHPPKDKPPGLETLRLGSLDAIAETLMVFGCNTSTVNLFRGNTNVRHAHVFPIAFELLAMTGVVFHIRGTSFRRLPNPTVFRWSLKAVDIFDFLSRFRPRLDAHGLFDGAETDMSTIFNHLSEPFREGTRRAKQPGDGPRNGMLEVVPFAPEYYEALHTAISACEKFLKGVPKPLLSLIVRLHLQVVLEMVNPGEPEENKSALTVDGAALTIWDLDMLSEGKFQKLADIYLGDIEPKVSQEARGFTEWAELMGENEGLVGDVWSALVFRMACWLLMHEFDEQDIQIPDKVKLYESREPAYII